MRIARNKFVAVTYDLYVGEGKERKLKERATAERPLKFIFGRGIMPPAFENGLKGLEAGDKFEFTIAPAETCGENMEERMEEYMEHIFGVPKSIFEVDGEFDEERIRGGNTVPMIDSSGNHVNGFVEDVQEDVVVMEFIPPLVSETLHFKGEVVDVHEPTAEETTLSWDPDAG